MPKFVLPDDEKKYDSFVTHHLVRSMALPDGPLYYYTSGKTCIDIIRTGEIWSTQLSGLNDAKEFVFALEELLTRTRAKRSENDDPVIEKLFAAVEEGLLNYHPKRVGLFVTCFSATGDDLSQWRAYGGGEGGYALVFNARQLATEALMNNAYLVKVRYEEPERAIILDDILKWTIKFFLESVRDGRAPSIEEWILDFLEVWSNKIMGFAAMLKHEVFKCENEWRLIRHVVQGDEKNMRFQQRNSMMTRHLPLQFAKKDGRGGLPLCGIIVGPCRHKEISKIAVGDLLDANGYDPESDVTVSETQAPYRVV